MNLVLLLLILLLLGGGGFGYRAGLYNQPIGMYGGGLGAVLIVVLVVLFLTGRL